MLKDLARWASRRPIAVTVFSFVITVLGIVSWSDLSLELFPDIQSPTVYISVTSSDRPAEQMERLYGERIERQLFTVPGIESIEQVVRSGKLVSRVTFNWNTDVDIALVDVNRAVTAIASDPDVDEVKVRRLDTKHTPVVVLGLTSLNGEFDLAELRSLVRRKIVPELEQLNGVAEVRFSGGRVKQIQLKIDPARIKAYGITIKEIRNRIIESNVDFNAGTLQDQDKVVVVRGKSRLISVDDVRRVVVRFVNTKAGTTTAVRVEDLANVVLNDAAITNLTRVNGVEGIGLFVYKEAGSNTVSVSNTVQDALVRIRNSSPDVFINTISNEAKHVQNAIDEVKSAAFLGGMLSIIVLVAFLRSLGPIVIISIAVPVSLLSTVFAMNLFDLTLNLMTLGGLALGIGMLVDNAIVVIESIFRCRSRGDSPLDAAINGTTKVGSAIITSTLTTCIVFMPVLFIEGMAAKLVSGISFTVVVSLISSLFVAIFLIPALSIRLLPNENIRYIDPAGERFKIIVLKSLHKPRRVISIALFLVIVAIYLLARLGTELLPPQDPKQFSVGVIAPPGQQLESTEKTVANVEDILSVASGKKIAAMLSEVGKLEDDERLISERYSAENTAEIRIRLEPGSQTASDIIDKATPAIAKLYGTKSNWHIDTTALTLALGQSGPPIAVEVAGNSLSELRKVSNRLKAELEKTDVLWNVQTSFEGAPNEIHLKINRKVAEGLGIDQSMVHPVIEAALDGLDVTSLTSGDENIDVIITLPKVNSQQLLDQSFNTTDGKLLTIGDIAELQFRSGAFEILRRNQQRIARVTALIHNDYSNPQARAVTQQTISNMDIPADIKVNLAGEEIERFRTMNELGWAAGLAIMLVLMVLAGSFESFSLPIAILASIPLALVGVALVLVPFGAPIGIMSILGFVVLVGIAVNNSILFSQTALRLIDSGIERRAAIAEAVSLRARPILMTTATTVFSLLPLALSGGEAAHLRSPMAWTILGGIIASTIACLFVIPCIVLSLDKLRVSDIGLTKTISDSA